MKAVRAISKAYAALPSYQDLADLVVELTEVNISGLGGKHPRVSCFTYGTKMPPHWQHAIEARKALLDQHVVQRSKFQRSTR